MREYDLSTVCHWIGNSPAVAAKHYAMSIDRNADFRRAIGSKEAQQNAQQSATVGHDLLMSREPGAHEKTPCLEGVVQDRQELTTVVNADQWARQDLNL